VRRVLSTSICVDERGEPRSAPLLLGYEPQVRSFLEGPTVPRSEAFEILPREPYATQPAVVEQPQDYPDHIPLGQVYAMAPPINPFKLMGKTADASSSSKARGKGKGKGKDIRMKKVPKKFQYPRQLFNLFPNQNPSLNLQKFTSSKTPTKKRS
jgi:hypothetical protein